MFLLIEKNLTTLQLLLVNVYETIELAEEDMNKFMIQYEEERSYKIEEIVC